METQPNSIMPLSLEKADYILSLGQQRNNAFRSIMTILREVQAQIQTREKETRLFNQVAAVVSKRYKSKISNREHLIYEARIKLQDSERDIERLTYHRNHLKDVLDHHEQELNETREYAEQRRNKKSKRESQYNKLYHVPIVATQYKKKYMRARDKNSNAEELVSEARTIVESCQGEIAETSRSISDSQKQREQFMTEQQQLEAEQSQDKDVMSSLQEGQKFWANFDAYQLATANKAINTFIETIQQHNTVASRKQDTSASFSRLLDPNNNFVRALRLAFLKYEEGEQYASSKWGRLQVEFHCQKCCTIKTGWPKPDKVRTHELLCDPCYQEYHKAMVLEKKMNKLGLDSRTSQLLSLPGASVLSFSSTSTASSTNSTKSSNSNSSSNYAVKPFKKVMNLLKTGKRNNSHNIPPDVANTDNQPRNHPMMMT